MHIFSSMGKKVAHRIPLPDPPPSDQPGWARRIERRAATTGRMRWAPPQKWWAAGIGSGVGLRARVSRQAQSQGGCGRQLGALRGKW